MDELEHKYNVTIKKTEQRQKLTDNIKNKLKNVGMMNEKNIIKLPGISNRILKIMKQEFVDCPVLNNNIQFIQCFICPNFQSRVMGKVLCKGEPIDN